MSDFNWAKTRNSQKDLMDMLHYVTLCYVMLHYVTYVSVSACRIPSPMLLSLG